MRMLQAYVMMYKTRILLLVAGVVCGWFFFVHSTVEVSQTQVVHRTAFSQQVSISGKVVAAKNVDMGFAQSGRIAAVYAVVGQRVSEGTILAAVENGDARAAVMQRQAALETQNARLSSLEAGTRAEQVAVTESMVTSSRAALVNAIRDAYRAADSAVHNTLDQFIQNPRTDPRLLFSVTDTQLASRVETERVSAEMMLSTWQRSVAILEIGNTEDSIREATHNLAQIAMVLSDANDALNHAIPNLVTTQATIDTWIVSTGGARTAINTALSLVTADAAALDTQQKNLELEQAGATQEDITAQRAQVESAQADVASAQAQLQKTLIVAPFSGIVTIVNAKTGSIASSGATQISMVSDGTFQIETYIPEINIVNVKVGDPAAVKLDAYGDLQFDAKVVLIDPAETVHDGVSTYKTTLQFTAADSRIRSGMTATTLITTAYVPDAIVVPKAAIYEKDGRTWMQVKNDRGVVERAVTVGAVSALGSAVIESGIVEGDTIVLNPKK